MHGKIRISKRDRRVSSRKTLPIYDLSTASRLPPGQAVHQGSSATRLDIELVGYSLVVAGSPKLIELRTFEDVDERLLIDFNPFRPGKAARCSIDTLCHLLLVHEDDHASEKTLNKIQHVGEGGNPFALCGEDIGVEDHLPLYASFRRKKRCGIYR